MAHFSDFALHKTIQQAIHDMGFEEPSPIQEQCIPKILEGGDLIGQAQTGTGKTAAFGLPLIEKMTNRNAVQAIVLTPTRELAIQVSGELRKIAKYKRVRTLPIYGGQSIGHQIRALKQGVQVVIGTPGRVLDHLRRKTLRLDQVSMLVLDEADEMLDMGFQEDIEAIIKETSTERQTLLFSATMPQEIMRLSRKYMNNPETVAISRKEVTAPTIEQVYYKVFERSKLESLCRILDSEEIELGIVFCRTKRGVDELTEALQERGYLASGLHGDLSQAQRDKVMQSFRDSSIELLVATDVAARGIDVGNVSHVVNYDIPQDPESYVHRIGRTGRAGRKGIAMTLVTPREMKQLRTIEKISKTSLESRNVPSIEEVMERQQSIWKEQLVALVEGDEDMTPFLEVVTQLKEEYPMEKVTAAALSLAFAPSISSAEEEMYDFGDTGASKGKVRFFMNIGRSLDVRPPDLVKEISELVGTSNKAIGRIDIFENFTFIEVDQEIAPFVYESLRHSRIKGKRINIEPAKPRSKR
ncbi:RNA helicase [Aneurinibacillus migulanus]|uniref:ATP-dependent RNA helicase CshA n=1 Tax=Aneurinibacillus migulanus TaxID=47500 RepID=A0A0D1XJN7_ANEMI|nr:DEAD/DEAH box helicase [Aneurinibacillus migulanus]KIV51814.1 RNA helicase [Aneurinibacillus migulanus]KIV54486.1 RNA helicase [Aneurinibacillus migulanus]KON97934.1 RNA helicase [Aneurinibacillus migulanus]KPD08121.1 RNA helicase [Aneurinibacillus migulanus]MCP1354100.1 DEAD/DEAH box helicase [Aneurinibacillus migulanus]